MEILTKEQSDFLKRNNGKEILMNKSDMNERIIAQFLKNQGYIKYPVNLEYSSVLITEAGKMYLAFEESYMKEQKRLDEELESLKQMADSAKEKAELAKSQAQEAKKDAKFSRNIAIISILFSLVTIITQIIELII